MSERAQDHYEVLGVPRSADMEQIHDAYRQLAKLYHPDVNKAPGAEREFRQIHEAYEVLIDAHKRQDYDWRPREWSSGEAAAVEPQPAEPEPQKPQPAIPRTTDSHRREPESADIPGGPLKQPFWTWPRFIALDLAILYLIAGFLWLSPKGIFDLMVMAIVPFWLIWNFASVFDDSDRAHGGWDESGGSVNTIVYVLLWVVYLMPVVQWLVMMWLGRFE